MNKVKNGFPIFLSWDFKSLTRVKPGLRVYLDPMRCKHTMRKIYLRKVRIFKIYISMSQLICLLKREGLLCSLSLVESEPILTWVLPVLESLKLEFKLLESQDTTVHHRKVLCLIIGNIVWTKSFQSPQYEN